MLQLKYPTSTSAIKEIEERLDTLSVAYKSMANAEINTPVLHEGQTVITGMENIKKHIDHLEIEIQSSRNFAC